MKFIVLFLLISNALAFSNLELKRYDNKELFKLTSEAKGRKVLLNFWASWCTSCIEEIPELEKLKKDHPSALFIGINAGENKKKIKKFLKKYKFSYLILEDRDKSYSKGNGIVSLPQTIVLDEKLKVIYHGHKPPKDI